MTLSGIGRAGSDCAHGLFVSHVGSGAVNEDRLAILQQRLTDRRSRRVVFVSHCLLNENVRYLGGAGRAGPVEEWLDAWNAAEVGICQMPCPEQRVWGGVLKRRLALAYGARQGRLWRWRQSILTLFVLYTKLRYAILARQVAGEMRDYRRSGFEVTGVVGVAGSPSCGVSKTLDVRSWLESVGSCPLAELDAARVNQAVLDAAKPGRGWFIAALAGRMERAGAGVSLVEHDLLREVQELNGRNGGTAASPVSN